LTETERPSPSATAEPARPPHLKRADIQALRAFAVVAVVVYHLWPNRLRGGFVGVDVFFVISGFLITGLLVRELDQTGTVSLREFYARRARRILPASFLVLVVTLVGCALSFAGVISTPASAAEPSGAPVASDDKTSPDAKDDVRFTVQEYRVLGNTVMDTRDIERLLYPLLGPGKRLATRSGHGGSSSSGDAPPGRAGAHVACAVTALPS